MKSAHLIWSLLVTTLTAQYLTIGSTGHPQKKLNNPTEYRGKYLGQKPPGLKAEKFNKGVLVGDKFSFNVSFSPDGNELFFSYYKAAEERPHPEYEIETFKQVNNIW